jgi:hypothetical protein
MLQRPRLVLRAATAAGNNTVLGARRFLAFPSAALVAWQILSEALWEAPKHDAWPLCDECRQLAASSNPCCATTANNVLQVPIHAARLREGRRDREPEALDFAAVPFGLPRNGKRDGWPEPEALAGSPPCSGTSCVGGRSPSAS